MSDFTEFEKMLNVSFESVIDICRGTFVRFGIPDVIQTDNDHS